MNAFARVMGRHTDLALIALVMGVLVVLFAPIPAAVLDFLILSNFSLALDPRSTLAGTSTVTVDFPVKASLRLTAE